MDRRVEKRRRARTFLRDVDDLLAIGHARDETHMDERFTCFGNEIQPHVVVDQSRKWSPRTFHVANRTNDILHGLLAVLVVNIESTQIPGFRCASIAMRQRAQTFQSFGHAEENERTVMMVG